MTPEEQQRFEESLRRALTATNQMLAQHARTLETLDSKLETHNRTQELHDRFVQEHELWLQEHERNLREHEQNLREIEKERQRQRLQHEHRMEKLDARIKHAIRLFVREARAERTKRRELDEKMTQLAASHLLTEEALRDLKVTVNSFIQSMGRGGNGHPQA